LTFILAPILVASTSCEYDVLYRSYFEGIDFGNGIWQNLVISIMVRVFEHETEDVCGSKRLWNGNANYTN
jgi:hypothetical protein